MGKTMTAGILNEAVNAMRRGRMVHLEVSRQLKDSRGTIGYITGIRDDQLTFTDMLNQSRFIKLSAIEKIDFVMK